MAWHTSVIYWPDRTPSWRLDEAAIQVGRLASQYQEAVRQSMDAGLTERDAGKLHHHLPAQARRLIREADPSIPDYVLTRAMQHHFFCDGELLDWVEYYTNKRISEKYPEFDRLPFLDRVRVYNAIRNAVKAEMG